MNWLKNMSVSKKIAGGFSLMAILMIVTVVIALNRINSVQEINTRVFELRMPTVLASTNMLNSINYSLAALRGYIILGNDKFRDDRLEAWEAIEGVYSNMQQFSKNWTNPDNVKRLADIGGILVEFKTAQEEIENISGTLENTPATKILTEQAAPRAKIMVAEITNIINMEAELSATKERKALLGMMARRTGFHRNGASKYPCISADR